MSRRETLSERPEGDPPSEPARSRRDEKRLHIRAVARRLVSEVGFREASIAALARAAGISTGAVYSYYPSKSALMADVVVLVSERELAVVEAIAEDDAPTPEVLADAVRTFAGRAFRNRQLAWSMIAEPADAEVDAVRLHYRRRIGLVFEGILRHGIADGSFRPLDVEAAAAAIVGGFMEALVGPLSPDAAIAPGRAEAIAAALADFAAHAVAASTHPD
jgi:AcrR family transcriptional regulator